MLLNEKKKCTSEQDLNFVRIDPSAKSNQAMANGEYLLRMQFLHQAQRLLITD